MRVAALQMVSSPSVAVNLEAAGQLLMQAADAGAELALRLQLPALHHTVL